MGDIDVTIVGNVLMHDSIGKHGPSFFDILQNDFSLSYRTIGTPNYKDIPKELLSHLVKPFPGCGKFGFWTYILGLNENLVPLHKEMREKTQINIAYSMFESDRIPAFWTNILNQYYDFVIVPDEWLVAVYKGSGVKIPIFVIPLGMMLERFLESESNPDPNVFTFGMTGSFIGRKNHLKVLEAFKLVFGNKDKFRLKLHGRFGPLKNQIIQAVKDANLSNVVLDTEPHTSDQYLDFMRSLNCYVFPSAGEGLSITPRESIALQIPTIISDNTAHETICESGYAIPVHADVKKPAFYEYFNNSQIGYSYDCQAQYLVDEMKWVYHNYEEAKAQVAMGKDWVKQYLWSSLKPTYLNVFKGHGLKLGNKNQITPDSWETTSKVLFEKMKEVIA